jgi:hypothetical protein
MRLSTRGKTLPILKEYNGSVLRGFAVRQFGVLFPAKHNLKFQKKLATPIETDRWEVSIFEISYPKGYKKQPLHNILRLDSMQIKFPVSHYTSLHDIFVTLKKHFKHLTKNKSLLIHFTDI